jgi:hypothetical protein
VGFSAHLVRWVNKKLYQKLKCADQEGRLIFMGQAVSFLRGVIFYTLGSLVVMWLCFAILHFAELRPVHPPVIVAVGALMAGYLMGFFHTSRYFKATLFAMGALTAWVLL